MMNPNQTGTILDLYDGDTLNSLRVEFNQIEKAAYDLPRENLDAIQSAPIKGGINKGAQTYTVKTITKLGMAKVIAENAKDLPQISIAIKKETVEIRDVGASYEFSRAELDGAAFNNMPLEDIDAKAARQTIDEKVDEIIYVGEKSWGLQGLLTNPNVTRTIAANNAGGTSKKWKDKTLDEITTDIQTMVDAVFNATKGPRGSGTVTPNTIKIPRDAFTYLTTKYTGSDSKITYLEALKSKFAPQGITNWELCVSAAGVGKVSVEGDADRALLYRKGEENVFSILPIVFRVLPPQYSGLAITYNCTARTGGCCWRRPTTGVYMDGV
jgi:hypothetical protein